MKKTTIFKNILFSVIPFILAIFLCNTANAGTASFYFDKIESNEDENTITASLNIKTTSTINASQSIINFNNNDLEIVKIDRNDSIFNLWIKTPRFSNSKGYIQFSGGTTDGFIGKGSLFTVVFNIKNKESSKTTFKFNKSMILAANGKGTNILSDSDREDIYINDKKISLK